MMTLAQLEQEVRAIKSRNAKVERDKRWETSATRKILLTVFTYLAIAIYLRAISVDRPWVNAIVPAIGFFLSTLTLPLFRALWEAYIDRS